MGKIEAFADCFSRKDVGKAFLLRYATTARTIDAKGGIEGQRDALHVWFLSAGGGKGDKDASPPSVSRPAQGESFSNAAPGKSARTASKTT